jgi:DNA-binding transcriptional LysR family regulator
MEMQQIRYFLALCEERNFTRAARRCGISQPSLTIAIIRLERELNGALFQRKPEITLTVLGHAVHPYLQRIAENADHARDAAQALTEAQLEDGERPAPRGGHSFGFSILGDLKHENGWRALSATGTVHRSG